MKHLLSAFCLLLSAFRLLLSADCFLPAAYCIWGAAAQARNGPPGASPPATSSA